MKVKMILAAAAMVFCTAAANAQEARYEFEKAVITTKTEMMGNPMITTYYIADYGKKEENDFSKPKTWSVDRQNRHRLRRYLCST